MGPRADISLLFDFFVTSQRLRRVLQDALDGAGMRPDQYAVYSLLFERGALTATEMAEYLAMPLSTVLDYISTMTASGHVVRTAHPFDGRALQLSLSRAGVAAHRRANARWEVVRKLVEEGLSTRPATVRRVLRDLDESALKASVELKLRQARAARG
jgi:DNA-binding MarR family transcriptional regulator